MCFSTVPRRVHTLGKLRTSRAKSGVGASHASHARALGRHICADAWAIPTLLCLPCALACQRASPHPRLRVTYAELPCVGITERPRSLARSAPLIAPAGSESLARPRERGPGGAAWSRLHRAG